jgi:hypothetical protein
MVPARLEAGDGPKLDLSIHELLDRRHERPVVVADEGHGFSR